MKIKKFILILNLLLLSIATAFAQEPPPPDGGDGSPGGVDDIVPIDDHIWVLVVLAFLLGVYLLRSRVIQVSK